MNQELKVSYRGGGDVNQQPSQVKRASCKVSKYTLFTEGDPIGSTNLPWGPLKQVNKPFINNNKQNA